MSSYPPAVSITEVLPRDGFQRLDEFVPTEEKVEIVDRLSETGVSEIEVSSFAHPEVVPQLRDAERVFESLSRNPEVTYSALVPNAIGMERAIDAEVDKANALVSASETYNRRNQGMTVEESLAEMERVVALADDADVPVEASIAMCFFCPYEGVISWSRTLEIVDAVIESGVDEVSLATSMGMADPVQVSELLEELFDRRPDFDPTFHLHDTNGMSLANVVMAMHHGVSTFDASLCGLGGGVVLPPELRDVGNTPTEDLVNMLREMGIETGVEFRKLEATARDVADRLELRPISHVLRDGTRENVLEKGDA